MPDPEPQELRDAIKQRIPHTSTAARFFETRSYSPSGKFDDILPQVRVSTGMATDIARYGNAHGLSASQTIRHLLQQGLLQEETHDQDD